MKTLSLHLTNTTENICYHTCSTSIPAEHNAQLLFCLSSGTQGGGGHWEIGHCERVEPSDFRLRLLAFQKEAKLGLLDEMGKVGFGFSLNV